MAAGEDGHDEQQVAKSQLPSDPSSEQATELMPILTAVDKEVKITW